MASAFVAICAATLADSLTFSLKTIGYVQRRTIVQTTLQSIVDETRSSVLTALPGDGTTTSTFTLSGSRTVTVTKVFAKVSGRNITQFRLTASWPETRGRGTVTDTMTFEIYLRGPE